MLVYLAMLFATFETLSILFNQFFKQITFLGFQLPLNISVVFFCIGFFILDLATELYDKNVVSSFIYGKIISQILFITFGLIGVVGAGLHNTQLNQILEFAPLTILYAIFASIVGYRLTAYIMLRLKVYYNGDQLALRYLLSTFPGEVVFSLVFSFLSFSWHRTTKEYLKIFVTLILVKLLLSIIFSAIVTPITKLIRYFQRQDTGLTEFAPFK